jgi:murein DD-endopeptidase MepM/ murein hydrolase activator NlpD
MRALRIPSWVAAVVVAACLAAATSPALAGPDRHLNRIHHRQQQVDSRLGRLGRRSHDVAARISVLDARRAQAEARVRALDVRLHRLDRRVAGVKASLSRVQEQVGIIHAELLEVQARLLSRTDVFTSRAVAIYEAGPDAVVDGLLSSQSFGDLLDRYDYYKSALNSDSQIIDRIQLLREGVKSRQSLIQHKEQKILEAKQRLEADRAGVARTRAQRNDVLERRRKAVADKKSLLRSIRSHRARLHDVAGRLQRESQRIEVFIATTEAQAQGVAMPHGVGRLLWPAAGPITSPFGMREDPVLHRYQLHAGIDIGAPYGASVAAAAAGTVIFDGVMTGYGNVVVIDHGDGLSTLYAHLSGYSVAIGQRVTRGEHVAKVGCTGLCTGPHLHFEVRIGGKPVDPVPFLERRSPGSH